jgi:AcrR family transcriptional regulator
VAKTQTPTKKNITRTAPRQERSKVKVEKILAAAKYLLIENGLDKLTTNHIAKQSNMSVGSLYQYFPNKQSILYELYQRWLKETRQYIGTFDAELPAYQHSDKLLVFNEIIDGIYIHREDNDEKRYEAELEGAMKLYPELQKADRLHGREIAKILLGIWKRMGMKGSEEELLDLGVYIYGLYGAYEESITRGGCDPERAMQWQRALLQSLVRQYLVE